MNNPVLYIILNGSLNMSSGKASAQAVHAAMMMQEEYRNKFLGDYVRRVIVLEASGREQMDGIADYLHDAGIHYEYYIDECVNEVQAFSMTAMIVEPFASDDVKLREIFSKLPLYGKNKKKINFWKRVLWKTAKK